MNTFLILIACWACTVLISAPTAQVRVFFLGIPMVGVILLLIVLGALHATLEKILDWYEA